jgi:hypothetical protein
VRHRDGAAEHADVGEGVHVGRTARPARVSDAFNAAIFDCAVRKLEFVASSSLHGSSTPATTLGVGIASAMN